MLCEMYKVTSSSMGNDGKVFTTKKVNLFAEVLVHIVSLYRSYSNKSCRKLSKDKCCLLHASVWLAVL